MRDLATDPRIEPLQAERVGLLRLLLGSRFTPEALRQHLAVNPGLSWRADRNGQYVVGAYWRRRPEIASVVELSTGRYRRQLVGQLVRSAAEIGCELVVAEVAGSPRDGAEWAELGFEPLDEILEYERVGTWDQSAPTGTVRAFDPDDLRGVLEVDRRAFPWLWWNSTPETARYSEAEESEIWVACDSDGELHGYVGLTVRAGRGHLDRLAVDPALQRRGIGSALLSQALNRFDARGAARVTLTTQHDNARAQPLYERFGFRQTRYRLTIYGRWLTARRRQ